MIAQIIKAVMASAAKAEIDAISINVKEAVPLRKTLLEMRHPQPRTPIQTDNSAANAVVNNNVPPCRLTSMDMNFHWLRDRSAQNQFRIYWRPGKSNLGDYYSKHHPSAHHKDMRSQFLTPARHLDDLRCQLNQAQVSQ